MKASTQKEIDQLAKILGISEIEIEYAGNGRKFKNTLTTRRARYMQEGKLYFLGMPNAWGDSGLFYTLQYQYGKKIGFQCCEMCGGTGKVWQSNYGSSRQEVCGHCGGYKEVPNNTQLTVAPQGA